MATARIKLRIETDKKQLLERAALISGAKNLTEYIINHMIPVAEHDIASATTITLPLDKFDEFIAACDKADESYNALSEAFKASKAMGFD
jgi:uncharacterized protein (DUF1778 family)